MTVDAKITAVDLAEVRKLEKLIDGKMYSATGYIGRGLEVSVVIPYGATRGFGTLIKATSMFVRAAWRFVA